MRALRVRPFRYRCVALAAALAVGLCGTVALTACGGDAGQQGAPAAEETSEHSSAENLTAKMSDDMAAVVDAGFDSGSLADWADSLLDLMPPAAVDAMVEQSGMTRDELGDQLGEMVTGSGLDQLSSYLDLMDLEIAFVPGDELSDSELEAVNSSLEEGETGIAATAGRAIDMDLTMTLLEDMGDTPAGTSQSQTQSSGFVAIEVDGSWYLWTN